MIERLGQFRRPHPDTTINVSVGGVSLFGYTRKHGAGKVVALEPDGVKLRTAPFGMIDRNDRGYSIVKVPYGSTELVNS